MPSNRYKLTALLISLCSIIPLDQYIKHLASLHLKNSSPQQFLGGFARLLYAENKGAWGNLGGSWPEEIRWLFLILLPLLLLLAVIIYLFVNRKIKKLEVISLSVIVSGGLGNLIDRIRFDFVVDMFWIGIAHSFWQTNIFNIADLVIMTGVVGIFICQFSNASR